MAVLQQTLNVRSIDEIKEIAKLGFENIDTNLSLAQILSYVVLLTEFDTQSLVLEQLPGESVYKNGVWVFDLDRKKTSELIGNVKFR